MGGGWNNTLIGCRAIAIGETFAGIADDSSAIFYNPAGLAFQQKNVALSINGFNVWPTPEETLDFTNIDVDKITFLGGIGIIYAY